VKICWDNLNELVFVKTLGKWRSDKWKYYEYVESCTYCGEPCFARDGNSQKEILSYCDRECASKCSKQRKKQGRSLSSAWEDPKAYKKMILNTNKARETWIKKRHQEVALLDKDKKVCLVCEKERDIKDFTKDSRLLTGLASACKHCKRKQYTKWAGYDGVRQSRNEYMRNKVKTDPRFKLRMRISNAIYQSLKGNKSGRHWETLVGYTLDDLKKHLEKQFTDGMTWENYGDWHIDHETPISVFNFTTPDHEDFTRCWSLKNLQPMWANENLSKGAKLEKHFQPRLAMEAAC